MTNTVKPLILGNDGSFAQLTTGDIINTGGTVCTTFTVGGRGLLFDDGSSTDGGSGGGSTTINLQTAYDNSPTVSGQAGIVLYPNKDFIIKDSHADGNFFTVSAADGTVTINGDLNVMGSTTTIETSVIVSDHQFINPASGTTIPLRIEPQSGVTPIVDLFNVKRIFGGVPVFEIDSSGSLIATGTLTITGLINGVDIVANQTTLNAHIAGTSYQHTASVINITPIPSIPAATNVQQALEAVAAQAVANTAWGFEFTQITPATTWTVNHNGNTLRASVTIYDTSWAQIIPAQVQIVNANQLVVSFTSAIAGSAMVILF